MFAFIAFLVKSRTCFAATDSLRFIFVFATESQNGTHCSSFINEAYYHFFRHIFPSCFAEFFVTYTADITPFANVYVYYIKVHLLFGQLSLPVAVAVN